MKSANMLDEIRVSFARLERFRDLLSLLQQSLQKSHLPAGAGEKAVSHPKLVQYCLGVLFAQFPKLR